MKVLFVPLPGVLSHTIPLLALNKKLSGSPIETAFLAPQNSHHVLRQLGVGVLPIDHRGTGRNAFRSEMKAYGRFSPDVVVDDASLTTGFATALAGVPRVTIQRTGTFPGGEPKNKNHQLSMTIPAPEEVPDVSFLGLPQPRSYTDFFNADFKIVPGVRSVEVLPRNLRDDPTYAFSGPLLMDDYMLGRVGQTLSDSLDIDRTKNFTHLRNFFDAHRDRKIVYLTFGTQALATEPVFKCVRALLDSDIAVVTSVAVERLSPRQRELFYFARYLPMHLVCAHADLVVHQCGSGTYHYPILHNVPAITIGTKCFDREDIALRLEALGVSTHIPAPDECEDFAGRFDRTIARYFGESGRLMREQKECSRRLKAEIDETSAAFNFEGLLRRAAGTKKARAAHG
jgi:hypothetical protein